MAIGKLGRPQQALPDLPAVPLLRDHGAVPSAGPMSSALDLLEAQTFDGPERAVHIRLAEHAGRIYLDLADACWRAVGIGPDRWHFVGAATWLIEINALSVTAAYTTGRGARGGCLGRLSF